jgi:hypothetical protein
MKISIVHGLAGSAGGLLNEAIVAVCENSIVKPSPLSMITTAAPIGEASPLASNTIGCTPVNNSRERETACPEMVSK